MPQILGDSPFHISEHISASNAFHSALGRAMGTWALIEERLSYWFEAATGMSYEMARAIFFAPHNFQARTDLLEAALAHNIRLSEDGLAFIAAATRKAGQYSSFRNQLAHGEQTFDARLGSDTFKQIILITGRHHPEIAAGNAVTIERLQRANERFHLLSKLLMDSAEFFEQRAGAVTPADCQPELQALPNQPDA